MIIILYHIIMEKYYWDLACVYLGDSSTAEFPIVITQDDRCLLLLLLLLLLVLAGTVSGVFVNHCNTTQWNVAARLA